MTLKILVNKEALVAVKYTHEKLVKNGGEYRWPDGRVSRLAPVQRDLMK